MFTKLRCGYNILNSSIGRFKNGGNKNCTFCDHDIESVEHFLFECPRFCQIRKDQLSIVNKSVPNFNNFSLESKLEVILDFNVPENKKNSLIGNICKFVSDMYNARKLE